MIHKSVLIGAQNGQGQHTGQLEDDARGLGIFSRKPDQLDVRTLASQHLRHTEESGLCVVRRRAERRNRHASRGARRRDDLDTLGDKIGDRAVIARDSARARTVGVRDRSA